MLIKYQNNPIVNVSNVSNVFIDRKNNKIIFNMNYSVKLGEMITSDYEYWKYSDLNDVIDYLDKVLEENGFITPNNIYNRYVNVNCVSSIKVDDRGLKVIYNLNSTVTHPDDVKKIKSGMKISLDRQKLTSDFVFIKFNNEDEFYEYYEKIESQLTMI